MGVCIHVYISVSIYMEKMKEDAFRNIKPLSWLRISKNPSTSATLWIWEPNLTNTHYMSLSAVNTFSDRASECNKTMLYSEVVLKVIGKD